jgi:hypothetical protein
MATKKLKSKSKPKSKRIVKPHNWTDGGDKVLILRCCNKDGSSYGGFIWPRTGEVSAPDWNNRKECGGGLHGWPWGMGIGEGKDFNFSDDLWIVFAVKPEDVVGELDNGWKCKAKCGVVVYAGEFAAAWQMVNSGRHRLIEAMVGVGGRNSSKAASSGNSSKAASSGNSSKAASSGNYSTAASSGDSSKASASGELTIAMVAGLGGMARAGLRGAFALPWKDGDRVRIAVGIVGEDGIEPDTWYAVKSGQLLKV